MVRFRVRVSLIMYIVYTQTRGLPSALLYLGRHIERVKDGLRGSSGGYCGRLTTSPGSRNMAIRGANVSSPRPASACSERHRNERWRVDYRAMPPRYSS